MRMESVVLVSGEIGPDGLVFNLTKEDLEKTARDLIGKPVTEGFDGPVIGKVIEARVEGNKIIQVCEVRDDR